MDNAKMLELIRELTALSGGAGREQAVAAYMAEDFRRYSSRVEVDAVGNVYAFFGQGERKVMVSAHTDEVGMFVKCINDQGLSI